MSSRISIGFILLMCALVLMKNAVQFGIYVHFKMNQKHIVLTRCENKEIPSCQGTCQFKKTLADHLPTESQSPLVLPSMEQQWWICLSIGDFDINVSPYTKKSFPDYISLLMDDKWLKQVFRPPIV